MREWRQGKKEVAEPIKIGSREAPAQINNRIFQRRQLERDRASPVHGQTKKKHAFFSRAHVTQMPNRASSVPTPSAPPANAALHTSHTLHAHPTPHAPAPPAGSLHILTHHNASSAFHPLSHAHTPSASKQQSATTSSLLLPLPVWLSRPSDLFTSSTVTVATSSDHINLSNSNCSLSTLVLGFASGAIAICSLSTHYFNSSEKLLDHASSTFVPDFFLVGHKVAVVALCLASIDVDANAGVDNVVLSASRDGEVAMWDLADGRPLHVNSVAFASGLPTTIN
ncbi:hypothetical protein HK096_004842, partial [Nowakowskiella sp. JEL0078]